MLIVMSSLIIGSSALLYGIGVEFHAGEEWSTLIWSVAIGATVLLSGIPYLLMVMSLP
jgi:hypothetical protein